MKIGLAIRFWHGSKNRKAPTQQTKRIFAKCKRLWQTVGMDRVSNSTTGRSYCRVSFAFMYRRRMMTYFLTHTCRSLHRQCTRQLCAQTIALCPTPTSDTPNDKAPPVDALTSSKRKGAIGEAVFLPKKHPGEQPFVSSEIMVLVHLLLDVDLRHETQLKRLIAKYGFAETIKRLHRLKRLLGEAQRNLDDVFVRCLRTVMPCRDVYHLAHWFRAVSARLGPAETAKILIQDHRKLFEMGEKIFIKKKFATAWGLKEDFEPHQSFVRGYFSGSQNTRIKIRRLKTLLPNWCLKALAERADATWSTFSEIKIRSVLRAIGNGLKTVMSESMVKDVTFLCLSQSPDILHFAPREISERYDSFLVKIFRCFSHAIGWHRPASVWENKQAIGLLIVRATL